MVLPFSVKNCKNYRGKKVKNEKLKKKLNKNSKNQIMFRIRTSGQSFSSDKFLISQSIFLFLHSLSDFESDQGRVPPRNKEINTKP